MAKESQETNLTENISSQPVYQPQEAHPNAYSSPLEQPPEQPMKWYKFVVNFQLIAGAILNGLSALTYLMGTTRDLSSEFANKDFYPYLDGLQTIDIIYGLVIVGLVVLALIARSELKKFSHRGPKLYLLLLAGNVILPIGYILALSANFKEITYQADILSGQVIGLIVFLIANYIYFKKRNHMFDYAL